jgi:glycosyltransferase involved in cell wall biosynthesis
LAEKRFLWLEGVFDQATVHNFPTISPASNFWQSGFLAGLIQAQQQVRVLGYPVERVFPFGRLVVRAGAAGLLAGVEGQVVGYLNGPGVRDWMQTAALARAARQEVNRSETRPDFAVVFSCLEHATDETPAIRVARRLKASHGIPWVCVVADGATPAGADGYVYLAWSAYAAERSTRPSIHIDGGVHSLSKLASDQELRSLTRVPRRLMYMGALTEHGGVTQLAQAFAQLPHEDVELVICGRGENAELMRLAATDRRLLVKGFVDERELDDLAREAYAFVNPRPSSFAPNRLNYPSKLLHYLGYERPVISTFTPGVSPEYGEVLVAVADESTASLTRAMADCLDMTGEQYLDLQQAVAAFASQRSWSLQIARFTDWLSSLDRTEQSSAHPPGAAA